MLSLKQALRVYLEHRLVVIRRRGEFELAKARQRLHILEGLRVALKHLDEIIDLIRKSQDADIARDRLMKRYRLSEIQAQAILDMMLRRLAALERKKIEDEYKELLAQIKELEGLLRSPLKLRQTVATELRQVKEAYGDRRRTQITRLGADAKSVLPVLTATDLLPEQTVWVSATSEGLVSRTLDEKPPRISGSAAPRYLLQVNTRDTLFLVSEKGEAAGIPVQTLPEAENPQDGAPIHKVSALPEEAKLAALFTLPPKEERLEGWYVFTATQQGLLKKTALEELPGPTGHCFTLVKVNEEDKLGWIRLTDGKADILLVTADGMAIRFHEDEVRPMGLVAAGVGGIKLGGRDIVIGMELVPRRGEILLVTSDGKAKRVASDQFPLQGRYGQGVIAWKLPRTAQLVGVAAGKANTRVTILIDKLSPKAMRLDEAPSQGRTAQGKTVVELKAGYQVLGVSIPWAVPRAVEGEKPSFEKEIEVPEEPEEPEEPEVEQLSFGMMEPPTQKVKKVEEPSTKKKAGKTKQKTRSAAKAKADKVRQASLISKPLETKEVKLVSKDGRTKPSSGAVSGRKEPATASKSTSKTQPARFKKKKSPAKAGRSKTKRKSTASAGGSKASSGLSIRKVKKSAGKAGKTKATARPAATSEKKTSGKAGRSTAKKTPPAKSKAASTAKRRKTVALPGGKKPTQRKSGGKMAKVKSTLTQLPIILPPSWKPPHGTPPRSKRKPGK